MSRQAQPFHLSDDEITYLKQYINTGKRSARAIKRAQILLHSHAGKTPAQICEVVSTSVATVYLTRQRYRQDGGQAVIEEKPRPGQPRRLSSEQEAALTVLACSEAPNGRDHWSVRLLADKAVQIGIVDGVGRETIRRFLKNTLKPWLKACWCIGQPNGEYMARMEDVLDLYAQAPTPKVARLCFDECPCQLLADRVDALPMRPGGAQTRL